MDGDMENELRSKIEKHREIKALIKNAAWRPITQAAINFHVDQKECANDHWKNSKVWEQAEAIILRLKDS